ncbi:MAG: IclR family transcriptional regulator [Actinobacteria bacterium]|nr:IclR family transcriptional regulator [Actinomycetota bacterium]
MARVPAADNTLRILDLLSVQRGPVAAQTVATALGLPRSSVYQLLTVMVERGFVSRLPEEKRFGLGPNAYALASSYTRQQPLTRLGAPLIARLVDAVGESGHLAVLHGTDVLYLVEERARNRPSLITDVGVRLPAIKTASGRALLAALPLAQLRALYPDAKEYATVKRTLEPARASGFASEKGDVTEGLASVAACVIDHAGWPAAAVAVTFLDSGEEPPIALIEGVKNTAAELQKRIHGQS